MEAQAIKLEENQETSSVLDDKYVSTEEGGGGLRMSPNLAASPSSSGSPITSRSRPRPPFAAVSPSTQEEQLIAKERSSDMGGQFDGIGAWKAWKKTFKTPMLALLDLFDNAVDASWTFLEKNHTQRASIPPPDAASSERPKPRIHADLDKPGGNRGIFIRNACAHTLPPLRNVFSVYKSTKGSSSIGENGVGVKQACAMLSGLSFVFTKTKDHYSMGLLMEALQREDRAVLPTAQFDIRDDLASSIRELAHREPRIWRVALEEYGAYDGAHDALENGITTVLDHFRDMTKHAMWKDFDNVFTIVLAKLRHASHNQDHDVIEIDKSDDDKVDGPQDDKDESELRGEAILQELKENLPFTYLHLHALDIRVKKDIVQGIYWEKRLVELTQFNVEIDRKKPYWSRNGPYWYRDPFENSESKDTIRFFAGFDPYRCSGRSSRKDDADILDAKPASGKEEDRNKAQDGLEDERSLDTSQTISSALKVYTYSRESGRLIKVNNDPRTDLNLSAGSSDFGQGLTIILDDYNGTIPLDPTKQDFGFGETEHGRAHEESIRRCTAAITHFYWNYHWKRFKKLKDALSSAVSTSKQDLQNSFEGKCPKIIPHALCRGTFNTFCNLEFYIDSRAGRKLRAKVAGKTHDEVETRDGDLVIRLNEIAGAAAVAKHEKKKTTAKRKRVVEEDVIEPYAKRQRAVTTPEVIVPTDHQGNGCAGNARSAKQMASVAKLHQDLAERDAIAVDLVQERDEFFNRSKELRKEVETLTNEKHIARKNHMELTKAQTEMKNTIERLSKDLENVKQNNEKLKETNKELRRQLRSGNNEVASTSNNEIMDTEEIAKMKRRIGKYKNRSAFFQEQSEAYKVKNEELMKEKRKLEERIASLLAVDCSSD